MRRSFNTYLGLTKRNILVFTRDKMAIILSMLTPIIVLGLYVLFLKSNYVSFIEHCLEGLESFYTKKDVEALITGWLLAGVLGTSVITVSLNSLVLMVSDKEQKIDFDYQASPAKGYEIVLAYFTAAFMNTFVVSAVILTLGFVMVGLTANFTYNALDILRAYGVVLLGSLSSTLILMLFVSFFKKTSALSSFGVLISAAIGFVIGAYIPVSEFSTGTQYVLNIVPGSQIAGLLRNALMNAPLRSLDKGFNGVDNGEFAKTIRDEFVLRMNVFGNQVDARFMLIFSISIIAIFLILNLVLYRVSSKRNS